MPRRTGPITAKKGPPAFQFYAGDWLASTLGMARDVKGLYADLLCWSWLNGPLPDDACWRQNVIGGTEKESEKLWAALRKRWRRTARGWVNPRLERQRKVQAELSRRAKRAAKMRWNPPAAVHADASIEHGLPHDVSTAPASPEQMPERWPSSSSSSSEDQDQPAPEAPVSAPPFKVYCAIASLAIDEAERPDHGSIAEAFKTICARQRLPYGPEITQRAIDAVLHTRSRRRA